MFKSLIRTFLDGLIAGILYLNVGDFVRPFFPPLPFGLSDALFLGVLVLAIDYILQNTVRI